MIKHIVELLSKCRTQHEQYFVKQYIFYIFKPIKKVLTCDCMVDIFKDIGNIEKNEDNMQKYLYYN